MPAQTPNLTVHARWGGFVYLLIILFGVTSEMLIRMPLIIDGDAAATAANILSMKGLFQLSFMADILMAVFDAILGVLLFVIFRQFNFTLALMALIFRMIQNIILGANLMNQHAALMLIDGAATMTGFAPEQLHALALHLMTLQSHGYDLALIFFGINSLILAWLIIASGYLPRIIGVLIAAAGLVYIVGSSVMLNLPEFSSPVEPAYLVPLVAESTMALYLLMRGVKA